MSSFLHLIATVGYSLFAAWFGLAAPNFLPEITGSEVTPTDGMLAGMIVLVFAVTVHLGFVRPRAETQVKGEIKTMQMAWAKIHEEVARARAEAGAIKDALTTGPRREPRLHAYRDARSDEAEVQVLQKLVEKLAASAPADPAAILPETGRKALAVMTEALRDNRVELYLQPVVTLPQRRHRYYECFSRLRNAAGEIMLPDQYLPYAEQAGMITTVDNMMLFRTVQLVRRVQAKNRAFGFFLNVLPATLADDQFMREFLDFLAATPTLAQSLVFEMRQSDFNNLGKVEEKIQTLKDFGFVFSIDQVTTLEFNLDNLIRQNVRFIKVDADILLREIRRQASNTDMSGLRKGLDSIGVDLIACKIESESVLLELLDAQIGFGQGYLFGQPKPTRDDRKAA
jgi:cyclic-di-GMP phosphodiesterase, flagellum assembly factor TipF